MKKPIFILLLSLQLVNLSAQNTSFHKVITKISTKFNPKNSVEMDNKEYVIFSASLNNKILITKLDSTANLIWMKEINLAPNNIENSSKFGARTKDNHIVVTGGFKDTTGNLGFHPACVKLNSNGDTVWSKVFRYTSGGLSGTRVVSITETSDKGFALLSDFFTIGPVSLGPPIVTKIDSIGNLQWSVKVAVNSGDEICHSIKQDLNNNFILTGNNTYSHLNPGGFIAKLSPLGQVIWFKRIKTAIGLDIEIQNNAYTILVNHRDHIGLIKTDTNANIIWKKIYNIQRAKIGYQYTGTTSFKRLQNGQFVIANGDINSFKNEAILIDSLGNEIMEVNVQLNLKNIMETKDQQLMLIGNGPICVNCPNNNFLFGEELAIIKTDSLKPSLNNCLINTPTIVGTIPDTITINPMPFSTLSLSQIAPLQIVSNTTSAVISSNCISIVTGLDKNKTSAIFSITPNPSNGLFKFILYETSSADLIIYNTLGNSIQSVTLNTNENNIDLRTHPKGIYYYQLKLSNRKIQNGKLVID